MKIREFNIDDQQEVIKLWHECDLVVPHNIPQDDIKRKLELDDHLFLVAEIDGEIDGEIIASGMGGYDGHRGWIYYLAVLPKYQSKGYGKKLVIELEQRLYNAGAPKVNLMVRDTNVNVIEFYNKLNYSKSDVVCLGKILGASEYGGITNRSVIANVNSPVILTEPYS